MFAFVMEIESLTFPEAMRRLADEAGIELPQRGRSREVAERFERNRKSLDFALRHYRSQWSQIPSGPLVRALAHETVRTFELGYAQSDGNSLTEAAKEQNFSLENLKESGLLVEGGDRIRDALIFPIYSKAGRLQGIVARSLSSVSNEPILSTKLYNPRRNLFGISLARRAIRSSGKVVLVSRFDDVMILHQRGMKEVVASPYGGATPEQVQVLKSLSSSATLVLVHNHRLSEINAVRRVINIALAGDMRIRVVSLPRGVRLADVDLELLRNPQNEFLDFVGDHSGGSVTSVGIALSNIVFPVKQDLYLDHAASVLELDRNQIAEAVKTARENRVMEVAAEIFQDMLRSVEGFRGIDYLKNDLGVRSFTSEYYGLGYAPDRWNSLITAAKVRGIDKEDLVKNGLVLERQSSEGNRTSFYDRFRGSIVAPVISESGQVEGFISSGAGESITYRNKIQPPSSTLDIAAILYGWPQCRSATEKQDTLLIVRHAADVWALHSRGVRYACALQGDYFPDTLLSGVGKMVSRIIIAGEGGEGKVEYDAQIAEQHQLVVDEVDWSGDETYEDLIFRIKRNSSAELDPLHKALEFATEFFRNQLDQGSTAKGYLENRGLHNKTIDEFRLGYAPGNSTELQSTAELSGIDEDTLEKVGLIIRSKRRPGYYNRFRDRIMFPIFSGDGIVIGFGGRILRSNVRAPKYLNTPETPVYHKSEALYGLHRCKAAAKRDNEVILVEGYTDVLALHQAGHENTVACCGTALTSGQITILSKLAKTLILIYDADEAGARAAERSIDLALQGGMIPYIVTLPSGEDPDSFVSKQGGNNLRRFMAEQQKDFVDFFIDRHSNPSGVWSPEDKEDAINAILRSIAKIESEDRRNEAIRKTSARMGVSVGALRLGLEDRKPLPQLSAAEELLLRTILLNDRGTTDFALSHVRPEYITDGLPRQLFEEIIRAPDHRRLLGLEGELKELRDYLVREETHKLSDRLVLEEEGSPQPEKLFEDAVWALELAHLENKRDEALQKMKTSSEESEKAQWLRAFQEFNAKINQHWKGRKK